jgi:outer membrane protein OmpA-like peptidoglycan-associated protein
MIRRMTRNTMIGLGCAFALAACNRSAAPATVASAPAAAASAATAATLPATPPATPPADGLAGASTANVPAAAPGAPVSHDPDAPTPLPAMTVRGVGSGQAESRYYAFDAGAGVVDVTATAKNSPSGSTQALAVGLHDAAANRLCFDMHGNTTEDKTITLHCTVDKPQRVILRLDLSAETIDYTVSVAGPLTLIAAGAASAAGTVAGAGSTDIDAPTVLQTNRLQGEAPGKAVSYYYAFNAGPGTLTLTADGSNQAAAVAEALHVALLTRRSERLCELALGNAPRDKRVVVACDLDKRQPVILRVDLAAESLAWRVRFEGPHDFEPFTPPAEIAIALDAAVLFDTGKSALKPEAQATLHEAATRVKKFAGARVEISGHTDTVGSAAANQALSEARAAAVKAWFVDREGIAARTLSTRGYGSTQPVADNATDAGRARNRRVDVQITPAKP